MARHDVLSMVPAANLNAANDFMVAMFGDDPGSQEIGLNAYQDGADQHTATHSIGVSNCSNADTNTLRNYLTSTPGDDCKVYASAGSGADFWSDAFVQWGLKPVVPGN